MRSLTFTAAALSLALVLLPGRAVIATPSAVDEFSYPAGDLNNDNGGSGFSDAWTQTAISGGPVSGSGVVASPGLTYPGLQTSGGAVTLTTPVSGTMSNDYTTTTYSRDLSSPLASPTGTGTTAYFSFLIRPNSIGTLSGAAVLFGNGSNTGAALSVGYVLGPHGGATGACPMRTTINNLRQFNPPTAQLRSSWSKPISPAERTAPRTNLSCMSIRRSERASPAIPMQR